MAGPRKRSSSGPEKGGGRRAQRGGDSKSRAARGSESRDGGPRGASGGKGRGGASGKAASRDGFQKKKTGLNSPANRDGRDSRDGRDEGRPNEGRPGGGQRGGRSRAPRALKGLGGDQVEGRQAVRELLLAGRRHVREIFIAEEMAESDIITDIEALSQELGVTCRTISKRRLSAEALTESHQGVIARAEAVEPADFTELCANPNAFLVVLDGVTDPGNLGTILRTAECSGVTGVVIGRHRSARLSPTVTKSAAGAVEHVAIAAVGGIPTAIADLKKAGVLTVGLDGAGESSLFDLPAAASGPIALVLGAEGQGLSRLVRERVDLMASIPLRGNLNSLNVAMATAVACFEVVRLRQHQYDSK